MTSSMKSPGWIFLNWFILFIIFLDMVLIRPNLAFYEAGELIQRRYKIIMKYSKFEIWLDLLSFLVLLVYISADYRAFVYLKLLFYFKAYSLSKVDKSLSNYLELHRISYLLYLFFRIALILFFIVIWSAAIYFATDYAYYISQNSYYQNNQLWLTNTLEDVDFIQDIAWPYWLLYAAYWASQITATIGYGVGTPKNPVTVAYCCFVIVLMTVIFSLFINTIWNILGEIQQSSAQYYQNWASLNKILKQKQISQSLNIKVSEYFHQVYKYNDQNKNLSISSHLSQDLKRELVTLSHLHIFYDIPLFQRWENQFRENWIQFKLQIFKLIEYDELAEAEFLKLQSDEKFLYCVLKGRMQIIVKICGQEQSYLYHVNERFGVEEFFLEASACYTVQSDCFTRLCRIARSKFIKCLKQFPVLYNSFVRSIEAVKFTNDRSVFNLKCWFCSELHTSFNCPTKTKWRTSLIHKDLLSMNYSKMLSQLDKTQSQQKKIYRNFIKSEKIYRKKLSSEIEIDVIFPHTTEQQRRVQIDYTERNKFNF